MAQYTWANCPDKIRSQVEGFAAAVRACLGDNFVGAYLHGSLALGGFNPERSDLDLLFVVRAPLPAAVQRDLAQLALHWSNRPRPLEFSVVWADAIQPWQYPPPYEFHFSESWRERLEHDISSGDWQTWPQDGSRLDPDLAAHFTVIRQRGVCLAGPPVETVIPEVPRADFVASIMADFNWALERINENPVYAVLNCCRVYCYLLEEQVLSKAEGASWALGCLPQALHPVVQQAWDVYRGDSQNEVFLDDELTQFANYMRSQVDRLVETAKD
ncbi:MAG TPA: aminoglycoside adenylyltransferase domain-containing protein [Phototrophicaceae bacterium]|nr:aminoglycoside adenylyltransferase domain-containing protein [Phototrophicaceae bacterium]